MLVAQQAVSFEGELLDDLEQLGHVGLQGADLLGVAAARFGSFRMELADLVAERGEDRLMAFPVGDCMAELVEDG